MLKMRKSNNRLLELYNDRRAKQKSLIKTKLSYTASLITYTYFAENHLLDMFKLYI